MSVLKNIRISKLIRKRRFHIWSESANLPKSLSRHGVFLSGRIFYPSFRAEGSAGLSLQHLERPKVCIVIFYELVPEGPGGIIVSLDAVLPGLEVGCDIGKSHCFSPAVNSHSFHVEIWRWRGRCKRCAFPFWSYSTSSSDLAVDHDRHLN